MGEWCGAHPLHTNMVHTVLYQPHLELFAQPHDLALIGRQIVRYILVQSFGLHLCGRAPHQQVGALTFKLAGRACSVSMSLSCHSIDNLRDTIRIVPTIDSTSVS